jgi:hypothetical protein
MPQCPLTGQFFKKSRHIGIGLLQFNPSTLYGNGGLECDCVCVTVDLISSVHNIKPTFHEMHSMVCAAECTQSRSAEQCIVHVVVQQTNAKRAQKLCSRLYSVQCTRS